MIKDSTSTSSRTTCFLGCFGFSGDNDIMQPINEEVNSTPRRRRWIPKWSFSCKKSSVKEVVHTRSKSKSLNDVVPAKSDTKWEVHVVGEKDPALTKELTKKHVIMVEEKEQKSGRKKWADIVRRENGSFRIQRKETKPVATSSAGAGIERPVEKEKTVKTIAQPFVSSSLKPLTQSKSLPIQKKQKVDPKPPTTAGGGVDEVVLHKTTPSGGEFDSVIAMSILLAILVIMLLWGKLCAIFCTCAWFLVVAAGKRSVGATAKGRPPESSEKLNLESVEYKKKVVLEGLLQRNRRNVASRFVGDNKKS